MAKKQVGVAIAKSNVFLGQFRKPLVQNMSKSAMKESFKNKLKIIPLGGLQEIGRNMTIFEYGNDILIVDMGLQFPDEDMPGVDYIIPDISYLKGKESKIRGVVITHGHYDHIGAVPHIMGSIGNPPLYCSEMTRGIIVKRQEDFEDKAPLNIHSVKKGDRIRLGVFEVEFFHVSHTIPGSFGLAIKTPVGNIVHTGDFKFDHSPVIDQPSDIATIARIGSEGVLALMSDSTDSQTEGYSISEGTIGKTLGGIIEHAPGRVIVATFAALVSRIQTVIENAERVGRKVAVEGYSMKTNVEIAQKLGYLRVRKGTLIPINKVNDYPDNKVVIICTGAQGESNAALMRIVNNEHRFVKIKKGDVAVFSSSVIPGNERTVQGVKDTLYHRGAKVIHYKMMDVHAGGHARQEDLKMMMNLIKPKYLIPVHGTYFMLKIHGELANEVGIKDENILIGENGAAFEFDGQGRGRVSTERVPTNYIMVDGLGVGDVGEVVLRDRQLLAKDGMFTIVVIIDSKTKKIIGTPQITSRGFIFVKENFDLVNATKRVVEKVVREKTAGDTMINWDYVKNNIRESVGSFLFTKTERRPMVLPVVIEV
ncbi:MAG TPA: ribonuclease J [Candidatus Moranbacteria bacterium]|jgi:ribonuclease J|nr:ribonuclease J [Candidatus Moranbacteria bacterium]HPX94255.1 ribonuclease J [Candidatus Moranbacteria bacterium]HQB59706.1 ribonuclease J [Candidatus Moranbacteria bacterium]